MNAHGTGNFRGQVEWTSPNGRWIITRRFTDITNPHIDVWRKDITVCPVTPFDLYIPKYVDRAWSRIDRTYSDGYLRAI
jgi:hypothetical protein